LGNNIGTRKGKLASGNRFLEAQYLTLACKYPEVLGLTMRLKCRLVRIDLVQQHTVAIVFRLKNVELHASRLVSDGSVRIRVYEAAKLRSRAFLEMKFDNDHEWHEPDLPLASAAFCCFAAFYRAAGLSLHVAENAEFEQV